MRYLILAIICITIGMIFSPYRSGAGSPPSPAPLLSPQELQRQINAVLRPYGCELIAEDGTVGPATAKAYMEAWSLIQVEAYERGNYE